MAGSLFFKIKFNVFSKTLLIKDKYDISEIASRLWDQTFIAKLCYLIPRLNFSKFMSDFLFF